MGLMVLKNPKIDNSPKPPRERNALYSFFSYWNAGIFLADFNLCCLFVDSNDNNDFLYTGNIPISIYENSNLATTLRGKKQRKIH